jgi:hypothetical protein
MPIKKTEPMLDMSDRVYVGVDIGKAGHVAGLLSSQLLRERRIVAKCPTLPFSNSRPGW